MYFMSHNAQQSLFDPEVIILFYLVETSDLSLPHSATVYYPAEDFALTASCSQHADLNVELYFKSAKINIFVITI